MDWEYSLAKASIMTIDWLAVCVCVCLIVPLPPTSIIPDANLHGIWSRHTYLEMVVIQIVNQEQFRSAKIGYHSGRLTIHGFAFVPFIGVDFTYLTQIRRAIVMLLGVAFI